ncbi:winged helix-turn-helix domain-containing protein [Candidatus Pacearchaeota archaeon]|nr:winged helix-turn-helix domain-containing protein [Candidatus Pacearchaeota archaeon]
MKKEKPILQNLVAQKIIGLLLKEEMSSSDLAEKIYGKRNVRSSISKYLKELKKQGAIIERNTASRRKLYKAKLEVLGEFDKKEYDFIQLVIERFWKPLNDDLIESLTNILLTTVLIKKIYKRDKRITRYNPQQDYKKYYVNKKRFWENSLFREDMLNAILERGERRNNSFQIRSDFIFVSLLAPETLFSKINGKHNKKTNPLYIIFNIFNN